MTIVKREGLGRPMTWGELDGNFDDVERLRTDAAQSVAQSGANANASAASAGVAERARDEALEAAAQVENDLVRVIKAPEGEVMGELPVAADRNDTLLGFGANGQPVVHPVARFDETNVSELWMRSLGEAGYNFLGFYKAGVAFTDKLDVIVHDGVAFKLNDSTPVGFVTTGDFTVDVNIFVQVEGLLRNELSSENGSDNVTYSRNTVNRTVTGKLNDRPTWKDFGVKGNRVDDDSSAIMEALEYCQSEGVGIAPCPGMVCLVDNSIFLPEFKNLSQIIDINFGGMIITPSDNVADVFMSGKKVSGVWQSAMGDDPLSMDTKNLTVRNLTILNNNPEIAEGRTAFAFKDLHLNCVLENLIARNFGTGFINDNCFYLTTHNNMLFNTDSLLELDTTGHIYKNQCNLMTLNGSKAVNVKDGYVFELGLTAITMNGSSFEGQGVGLVTKGEVHDLKINGCYLENVGDDRDTCFDFQSYTNVKFTNNYLYPRRANYLIQHATLPRNSIDIDQTNNVVGVAVNSIFKNKNMSFARLGLQNSYPSSDLSNTVYRMGNLGNGVVIDKKIIHVNPVGAPTHVSDVVNELIPTHYSGRRNTGLRSDTFYGLYNAVKDTVNGYCDFDSKIIYTESQYLLINVKIADTTTTRDFVGTIWGSSCRKPDGTVDSRVVVSNVDGMVHIRLTNITVGSFNILGAEIRVL